MRAELGAGRPQYEIRVQHHEREAASEEVGSCPVGGIGGIGGRLQVGGRSEALETAFAPEAWACASLGKRCASETTQAEAAAAGACSAPIGHSSIQDRPGKGRGASLFMSFRRLLNYLQLDGAFLALPPRRGTLRRNVLGVLASCQTPTDPVRALSLLLLLSFNRTPWASSPPAIGRLDLLNAPTWPLIRSAD